MTVTLESTRPHGYARYRLDGCRCYTCAFAVSEYNRRRSEAIEAGTWQPWSDAQPVRDHLSKLKAAGIGEKRVASLAGVSRTAISALLRGRRGNPPGSRVRTETAEAVLAVPVAPVEKAANKAIVEGVGTARRIRALCCLGWSLSKQAELIGWSVQNYAPLARVQPITAKTARLVAELYDQLSMQLAPAGYSSTRTRAWAASQEWVPPLEWDDEALDDPAAVPASTPNNGSEMLRAWLINYRDAVALGLDREQICDRLGVTRTAIKDKLRRARLNGWEVPETAKSPLSRGARVLHPCGTPGAYARHIRRGEPVDAACAEARRAYQREVRRRTNETNSPISEGRSR